MWLTLTDDVRFFNFAFLVITFIYRWISLILGQNNTYDVTDMLGDREMALTFIWSDFNVIVITFSFIDGFHSYLDKTTLRHNGHVGQFWLGLYLTLTNQWIPIHKRTKKVEGYPCYVASLILPVLSVSINFPL